MIFQSQANVFQFCAKRNEAWLKDA
jgi:hypothetical protein